MSKSSLLMFSGIPSLGFPQRYINTSWLLLFLMRFIHSSRLPVGAEWLLLPSFFLKYLKGSIMASSRFIPLVALKHEIIYSVLHLRLCETQYYKYLKYCLKPFRQWIKTLLWRYFYILVARYSLLNHAYTQHLTYHCSL